MSGKAALTFDDGPDPLWTPRVLDALAEAAVLATFFVVAPRARRHAPVVRRVLDEGHEVGFHCVRHARHDRMNGREILAEAEAGPRALRELGCDVRFWRTPWGVVTPDTVRAARGLGLRLAGWTADSEDWRGGPPEAMIPRMEPNLKDGAVLLMHDGVGPGARRTGCAETAALVGPLVALLRSRGLEPGPLGALTAPVPDRNPGTVSRV